MSLNSFFIQVLMGLTEGANLILIATGLTLVFGMMQVINFAHSALFMLGAYVGRPLEQDVAAGRGHRHGVGAGLDAVGQDIVLGAGQAGDAADADGLAAGALDPRAHLRQALGEVEHLRLPRGVLDGAVALGEAGGHQEDMGGADGAVRQGVAPAFEAPRRAGDDIAAVELDLHAERGEPLQEEVDRPGADGAAAGQRHPGVAHARQERADHPEAGAHARDELVGRGSVDDRARRQLQRLAVVEALARLLAEDGAVDAVIAEDALQQRHVGEVRHIVQGQRLIGEEAGDHQRQRGVLGAGDVDGAGQLLPADDADAIHVPVLPGVRQCRGGAAGSARLIGWLMPAPLVRPRGRAGPLALLAGAPLRLAPPEIVPQRRRQPLLAGGLRRLAGPGLGRIARHGLLIAQPTPC